jgi:hypothetical protein
MLKTGRGLFGLSVLGDSEGVIMPPPDYLMLALTPAKLLKTDDKITGGHRNAPFVLCKVVSLNRKGIGQFLLSETERFSR